MSTNIDKPWWYIDPDDDRAWDEEGHWLGYLACDRCGGRPGGCCPSGQRPTGEVALRPVTGLAPAASGHLAMDEPVMGESAAAPVRDVVGVLVPAATEPPRAVTSRRVRLVAAAGVPAGLGAAFGVGFWLGDAGVGVALLTNAAGMALALLLVAFLLATGGKAAHCPECPGVDR